MAFTKDPDAALDFTVDWATWLTTGDTIAASLWVDTPAGITVDSDTFTGTTATVVLSGGAEGHTYTLTNRVTTTGGLTEDQALTIRVSSDPVTPELPDFCWPVDTSCVTDWDAWEVEPDPEADPPVVGVPLYTEAAKARAVSLAAQSLRMLTAYRVGGCPVTVRPAARRGRDLTWRTYPVAGGSGSTPWQPVDLGGQWLNIGCGHDGTCGCLGIREVRLGAASSVAEVKVDGLVLDPTAYRLDPGGRLVRLDGEGWPLCQNLAAPDTEAGTWAVTYTAGAPVDGHGAYAAGVLAGEFVRACSGGTCRLPDNIVTLTRQGVTMTFGQGAFPEMRTGLREVDAYLERWNPNRHKSAPLVWSPDLHRPRRTS